MSLKRYVPALADFSLGSVLRELQAIGEAANREEPYMRLQVLYAAPAKTFAGMMVYADGTTWNPGSGQGVYVRNLDNSAWRYLG